MIRVAVFVLWLLPFFSWTQESRDIYNWQTGKWGICWSEKACGKGTEERTVWCGDLLGRPVPPQLCDSQQRPNHSRPCFETCKGRWSVGVWSPCRISETKATANGLCEGFRERNVSCIDNDGGKSGCSNPSPPSKVSCMTVCPKSCAVGPWSEWSSCEGCVSETTYRTRQVVIAPSLNGQKCPNLMESKRCDKCSSPKMQRMVNEVIYKSEIEIFKLKLEIWGECKVTQLADKATLPESDYKDSLDYIHSSDADYKIWADYKNLAALSLFGEKVVPKIGYQDRNLSCVNYNGEEVSLEKCSIRDKEIPTRRTCVVPVDCEVTEWSNWQITQHGCTAQNGQKVPEIKIRKRVALILQIGEGKPCPHLVEKHSSLDSVIPCTPQYEWISSSWGPCQSTVGPTPKAPVICGGGIQERLIVCVRIEDQITVEDTYCEYVEPPPMFQRCEVGCERDCVMGPWSAWGICIPISCSHKPTATTPGFRRRSREIIVIPSMEGEDCPHLQEQIECNRPQCHQWQIGEWSECLLKNSEDKCGPGKRHRHLSCLDAMGVPTLISECEKEVGPMPAKQDCQVACPFDCILAPWSSWSPCSKPCANQITVGYTSRNTSIIGPAANGGEQCPPPDELTQIETCRDEPCSGVTWSPGRWSDCELSHNRTCGQGIKLREFFCIDQATRTEVSPERCYGLKIPKTKRTCEVKCSEKCVLSKWSEWSDCLHPSDCATGEIILNSVQKRWRKILSNVDANECGNLEEERACAMSLELCKSPSWKASTWSSCIIANGLTCGTGFRSRSVDCINGSGEVINPTHCLLADVAIPESSEECYVFCNLPCSVSKWTEWSDCSTDTLCSEKFSKRSRSVLNGSCVGIELDETQKCSCDIFESIPISPWSQCALGPVEEITQEIFDPSIIKVGASSIIYNSQENENDTCGVGTRYRSLKCIRRDGAEADPSHCGHNGLESEPCMKECSADCLVDAWENWSQCNVSCGAGMQVRHRQVVQKDIGEGRICPETRQERACFGECNTKWIADGWTECALPNNSDCEEGTQERTVKCSKLDSTAMEQIIDNGECDLRRKPEENRTCKVACIGECVVSDWSQWSTCSQNCSVSMERSRTRTIMRYPAKLSGDCPHLEEREPCLINVGCWQYTWSLGNWTSCIPLGHSSCGEGVRNRPISCVRSDGQVVHERFCSKQTRPVNLERWCYVDCPVDCRVTTWGSWDRSQCSCGEKPGNMSRKRHILVNPSDSGRLCPINLEERLPCPYTPCYMWERGPWSECNLNGAGCGHGYMERIVRCKGPGGIVVPYEKCLTLINIKGHTWPYIARTLDLNTKDGCYVPCNGECQMTEWSPWSHCHRDCTKGEIEGHQTRSRAIISTGLSNSCPADLWETRPCISGPCLTFSWQIIHGQVSCVRSDGIIITGGCGDVPKPCIPECTISGSLCSPVGVCVCSKEYHPKYSDSSIYRLIGCIPNRNYTAAVASPLNQIKYLPDGINGWMFAMLGVGTAFVVFVAISVYVMCKSPRDQTQISLSRHQNLAERSAQFQ